MNENKPVAIYCRVSSKYTQHNENQRLRLETYCKQNNFEFVLFEEKESTRKTRPVKQDLMNACRSGKFSAVIVTRLDRFARSFSELIFSAEELINKNVRFVSLSENLDFSSATGQLMFRVLSAFANFERELIRERTLDGLQRARVEGKRLGRPVGARDKRQRKKSGYYLREERKKISLLQTGGDY